MRRVAAPSWPYLLRRAASDPFDAVQSAAAVARARLALRGCEKIGFGPRLYGPCLVSGAKGIEIGDRLLMIGRPVPCQLTSHDGGRLEIGNRVFLNYGSSISAHSSVRIGDDCKIGQYSIILDCDYHDLTSPTHDGGHGPPGPIVLEDGVWLGARVTVLKGVTIGRGSVIGAGCVVTHDIPAGVIAGGVPARVLRGLPFAPQS
jgi:maltose O-acetyltransferase